MPNPEPNLGPSSADSISGETLDKAVPRVC